MKRSRFTEEQILFALKQVGARQAVAIACFAGFQVPRSPAPPRRESNHPPTFR